MEPPSLVDKLKFTAMQSAGELTITAEEAKRLLDVIRTSMDALPREAPATTYLAALEALKKVS